MPPSCCSGVENGSIIENNGGHLTFRRIEPNGIAVDLFVKKKEE